MITIHVHIEDHAGPMLEKLDELLKDSDKKAMMTMAIAEVIYNNAVETCPSPTSTHYPTNSTGNLRDSHEYHSLPDGGAMVSATADYALYVHEGHYVVGGKFDTRIRGEDMAGKKSYEFVAARPWMTIAIEQSGPEIQERVKEAVEQAVNEAAGEPPETVDEDISQETGGETSDTE